MKRDLPIPEDILEELTDKVAVQIDRLAPVAFDSALKELTAYHRFLLGFNATHMPDGSSASLATIADDGRRAPHAIWTMHYGRLFERAANRLPESDYFLYSLSLLPRMLAPGRNSPKLPAAVMNKILDLGPTMVGQVEAWITKRKIFRAPTEDSTTRRLALAGSDVHAYTNLLPRLVSTWEGLVRDVTSMYGLGEGVERDEEKRWAIFRQIWPILWHHLSNTAYCLAMAAWNEDEAGTNHFREALVRWPRNVQPSLRERAELRHRRLLYPGVLDLDWSAATARASSLGFEYMPAPAVDQVFASILRGAHDDVVLLTASLLLFWTASKKHASDIGARAALSLLLRDDGHDDRRRRRVSQLRFHSLFLDLVRLRMAGERGQRESYATKLDSLVAHLDRMTERPIVPGRVYTPSTIHGKHELCLSYVATLLAAMPDDSDDGLVERIVTIAREEDLLPDGDFTLRNILEEFEQWEFVLEEPWPDLGQAFELLVPNGNTERLSFRLQEIIASAKGAISEERDQRLRARPVDVEKIESIRSAIEMTLLEELSEVPVFDFVKVERASPGETGELHRFAIGRINKAQLTNPPMESAISNFVEHLVSVATQKAGTHAWRQFLHRERRVHVLAGGPEDEDFWREIFRFVGEVGPNPALVVSGRRSRESIRRLLFRPRHVQSDLKVARRRLVEVRSGYIATINHVNVFGAELPSGTAWLFSDRLLSEVRYAQLEDSPRFVDVSYESDADNLVGVLRIQFCRHLVWSDTKILEFHAPDLDADV